MHGGVTAGFTKSTNGDRHCQTVVQGSVDLRALRHTNEGARVLQRMTRLPECVDSQRDAVVSFRMPVAFGDLKMD